MDGTTGKTSGGMVKEWYEKHGAVWPLSIPVSHSWVDLGKVMMAVQYTQCKTFIEFGVHRGGLSSLLIARTLLDDLTYFGFEINENIIEPKVKTLCNISPFASIYIGDLFHINTYTFIRRLIKKCSSPVLIYCDNGNKALEFRMYRGCLREGDFIMMHDFNREFTIHDIASKWWTIMDTEFTHQGSVLLLKKTKE